MALGFTLDELRCYHMFAGLALPVALVSAGAHLATYRRITVVLISAAYGALAVALDRHGSPEGVAGFATFYLAMAIAWGLGAWLRKSRAAT